MYWNSLNEKLRQEYGGKVYKLALTSGCTCPNRDGTLGNRGCIFCDGAGAFAESGPISMQLEAAKGRVSAKAGKIPSILPISRPSQILMRPLKHYGNYIPRQWNRKTW